MGVLSDRGARQLAEFQSIAESVGGTMQHVSQHMSKRLILPVVKITVRGGFFMLRDNFHDVNVYVEWDGPLNVAYADFCESHDFAWYQDQMSSCRGYVFRSWLDEEMDDPRILRVKHPNGHWSNVEADFKDKWARRYESTDWYSGWSSGTLVKDGDVFYVVKRAFAEGMPHCYDRQPFVPGSDRFICAVNCMDQARELMQVIVAKNQPASVQSKLGASDDT